MFDDLQDMLDDDIGYIPTVATKKQQKAPLKALSRQSSTKSINKDFQMPIKETPPPVLKVQQEQRQRRTSMFGLHKQAAKTMTFEQVMKNQNKPQQFSNLSRPPLPQRNNQRKDSISINNFSPQLILDEKDQTFSGRRGGMKPPIKRRQSQQFQNRSQTFPNQRNSFLDNPVNVPIKNNEASQPKAKIKTQNANDFSPIAALDADTNKQMKKLIDQQLQFQKKSMQALLTEERIAHQKQIQSYKKLAQEELQKKLYLKDYEITKLKQFYQLQLKLYKDRQNELSNYSIINKKLESNISMMQKFGSDWKNSSQRMEQEKKMQSDRQVSKKEDYFRQRQNQLKDEKSRLQAKQMQLRQEKARIYAQNLKQKQYLMNLQAQISKKQAQLQGRYKKKQKQLAQQYQKNKDQLNRKSQSNKLKEIEMQQTKNKLQYEKQEHALKVKNFETQKKEWVQEFHLSKTKFLQKQIHLATKINQIQIKQNQIQMNAKQYINKLQLLQLQRKKLQIERSTKRNQISSVTLGQFNFNRTSNLANRNIERQGLQGQIYKKSITQIRDEFLKSLPQF